MFVFTGMDSMQSWCSTNLAEFDGLAIVVDCKQMVVDFASNSSTTNGKNNVSIDYVCKMNIKWNHLKWYAPRTYDDYFDDIGRPERVTDALSQVVSFGHKLQLICFRISAK